MRYVGHDPECPEDVVRVGGSFLGNDALEDDLGGFLDGKLGAFDEIGEVGFKKGKRCTGLAVALRHGATLYQRFTQCSEQGFKQANNRGQYRLFVLWTRAVTPRGIAIDVGSPATDALGRSGVDGRIDNFFWQRFGTALLFSLVEDAATVGSQAIGNTAPNTTRVPSDAASTILQQNSQIRPVLRKNQGEDVGITVAQDFDFSTVYGLALK